MRKMLRNLVTYPKKLINRRRAEVSKRLLGKYLSENAVIVECGAYTGKDTEEMALLWPESVIHAFEPVPAIYRKLVSRTKPLHNVHCYKLALAESNGTMPMFISGGGREASSLGASSLLQPKKHIDYHPEISFSKTTHVKTITLDTWAFENRILRIDMLWLDAQGYELNILKAGSDILKSVSIIYTEVNLKELYAGGALYPELKAWLEHQAFRVAWEGIPWVSSGNVLFVRDAQ